MIQIIVFNYKFYQNVYVRFLIMCIKTPIRNTNLELLLQYIKERFVADPVLKRPDPDAII